ncbi:MAG: hypothetical protein JXB88_02700 [Spirochaetales bacterium]|nr:hypothetical protein [Spirochaetales bacterium]
MKEVKESNIKLAAVFLLSLALIAYELAVMRTFSVGNWSNFGSMVISIALLGFGLSGTLLTFIQKTIKRNPGTWLSVSSLLLPPAMTFGHIMAQQIPFNPVLMVSDPVQLWWIGAYYLIYSVPFLCGALFIGVAFIALSSRIHELYFFNMLGSGIGGFIILLFMYLIPTDKLIVPILFISFIAGILCSVSFESGKLKLKTLIRYGSAGSVALIVSLVCIFFWGKITVSDYKAVSYVRRYPEYKLDYYSYSPLGEIHVYSSSYFHFAPGLSDNASSKLERMPEKAFKGLFIDGGGPVGIMRKLDKEEEAYIDYLPMTAPYLLLDNPGVLLIGLGGGAGVFTALHHHASRVTAIEPNPEIVRLLRDVPVITGFNKYLLDDPRVDVRDGEPRAFCSLKKNTFDLVELSLIDSVGLSQTAGYPVRENFTYTVQGMRDYMSTLKENGILSVTVWNKLSPPRNVLRLLSTVVSALATDKRIKHPERRIFMFHMLLQTATVLVKNSDFTEKEISILNEFCKCMSFTVSYYPGIPVKKKDFDKMVTAYTELFSKPKTYTIEMDSESGNLLTLMEKVSMKEEDSQELDPADLYHFSLQWMLNGRMNEFIRKYIFDIRPATDDRPYYTGYIKPHTIGMFLKQLNKVSEEWGYLMLPGTLIQSLIFGALIICIPLIGKWKELFKKRRGTPGVIIYYACLGLGYMLIELFLIQKLVFFLSDPVFSLSTVITSMLVISGLGSLFCSRFKENWIKGVRIAVFGISLSILFYIVALNPLLSLFLGYPFPFKIILAILFIAPSAFFLGMPFPSGLSALSLSRKGFIPWAWGMNGALSVTGTMIARIISVSFGFFPVLVCALGLYLCAGILFPSNCIQDT